MNVNRIAPLLLAICLGAVGCASTPPKGMLAADAPRALPAAGPVDVSWNDPATFAELRYSINRCDAARGGWLTDLAMHVREKAERRLAPGERLALTIVDVDRAGDYEPGQNAALYDTRILRDIYPPRMTIQFRHYGAGGTVVAEGERKLTDLGYMTGVNPIHSSDPLRFEKRMIDTWLRRELNTASR